MPRYGYKKQNKIIALIQEETSKDPLITIDQLRALLFKHGITTANGFMLDPHTVIKYMKKGDQQAIAEVDRGKLNHRIAKTQSRFNLSMQALFKIAFWKWDYLEEGIQAPTPMERVGALRTILQQDLAMLHAEIISGIYKAEDLENAKDLPDLSEDEKASIDALEAHLKQLPEAISYPEALEVEKVNVMPVEEEPEVKEEPEGDTGPSAHGSASTPTKVVTLPDGAIVNRRWETET